MSSPRLGCETLPQLLSRRPSLGRSWQQVSALSQELYGTPAITSANPSKYTGKLLGVEYLLAQQGQQLCPKAEDLDREIDEGFGDVEFEETELDFAPAQEEPVDTAFLPTDSDTDSEDEQEVCNKDSITRFSQYLWFNQHSNLCMHLLSQYSLL